jgi:hypothetical protein
VIRLVDDLDVIAQAGVCTARYQSWRPEDGVPVRITVGAPKFWWGAKLADGRVLAPWGLMDLSIPTDECRQRYVARLDARADRVVAKLAQIARQHPGERLVLCCFEDVAAGEECHRRWAAEWFEARYGIVVPELPKSGQLQFPL